MKYIGENAIKKLISLIKGDLATKQPTITASGLLKGDGAGTVTAADTQEATLVDVPNGLLKGDGTTISAAVAETDYMVPPTGGTTGQVLKKTENGTEWADAPQTVTIPETTALLKGDGVGGVAAVTTDATPTQGSSNPVTSGGVKTELDKKANATSLGAHTNNTENPHRVTAAQAGAIPSSEKSAANGVATLDADALLAAAQRPKAGGLYRDDGKTTLEKSLTEISTTLQKKADLGEDGKVPESQLPGISAVKTFTATIGTTWTENEDTGVKSQNVAIPGVLAKHTAKVDHAYTGDGTSDGYVAFVEAENQYLTYITNGYAETYDGGIAFHIFGDAPTVSIPIVVEVA